MKLVPGPLKGPSPATIEAIKKLKPKLSQPPPVPKAVPLKIQPRQTVKLPGGGYTVVNTKTWW